MAQKLTLTEYLRRRGAIKALTRIEAEAFGIPWPLQSGWPARFACMEITVEMLDDLQHRMETARQSTVKKARCGLEGAGQVRLAPMPFRIGATQSSNTITPRVVFAHEKRSLFPGFVLRQAKRYRSRYSKPWE